MLHRLTERRRTRLGAGLAAAGLVAGLALTATPVHADDTPPGAPPVAPPGVGEIKPRAGAQSTYVHGRKSVTSTKNKKLAVSLSASRTSVGGISVLLSKQRENHNWAFKMPARNLAVNSKGEGSLKTTAAAPFGKVALKIVPKKSWKLEKCQGKVVYKTRPVTLKGVFFFDSKSGWGAVGSKSSFSMPGSVTIYTGASTDGCYGGGDPCPTFGGSWFQFNGNTYMSGSWRAGADTGTVYGSRTVQLSKPAGAYRYDSGSALVDVPDLAANDDGSAVLDVKTGRSGAKGTATLAAPFGSSLDGSCTGGVTYTSRGWYSADYTNGSTPLQIVMSAFGNIKLPNGTGASFNRTVKTSS